MSCRLEFDALNALHEKNDDDTVIVAVSLDKNRKELKNMIEEEGLKYPIFTSAKHPGDVYQVNMLPTSYVINPEGKIAASSVGYSPGWNLERLIESID